MTNLITRLREAKELTFNLFWEVAEHLNVEADGRLRQLTAARAWESAAVALAEQMFRGVSTVITTTSTDRATNTRRLLLRRSEARTLKA